MELKENEEESQTFATARACTCRSGLRGKGIQYNVIGKPIEPFRNYFLLLWAKTSEQANNKLWKGTADYKTTSESDEKIDAYHQNDTRYKLLLMLQFVAN